MIAVFRMTMIGQTAVTVIEQMCTYNGNNSWQHKDQRGIRELDKLMHYKQEHAKCKNSNGDKIVVMFFETMPQSIHPDHESSTQQQYFNHRIVYDVHAKKWQAADE